MPDTGPVERRNSAGPRIGVWVIVIAALVVGGPALVVLRPWQGIDTGSAIVVGLVGIAVVTGTLVLLRQVSGRNDWYQARVRTSWSSEGPAGAVLPDGAATVTVVCTDLVARGRFQSFVQHLRHVLPALGGERVVAVRVEPSGKENAVHVDTTYAGMHVVFAVVRSALAEHGISPVELMYAPSERDAPAEEE